MQGATPLNFNFQNVDPNFSGGAFLPVSDDKGWLVILTGDNGWKPTNNGKGNYLELAGVGQDQQIAGQEFVIRLNLQHTSAGAMQAANSQLSALGHVMGLPGMIQTTADLFNKPFRLVSEKQKNAEGQDSGYTQLANNGIRDVNGNKPGKSGPQVAQAAPQVPQQQNNQAGPQAGNGGGWGGQPQGGNVQQQNPQQQWNPNGGAPQGNQQPAFEQGPAIQQGQQPQGGGWNPGPVQGQQANPAAQGWGGQPQGGAPQGGQGPAPSWAGTPGR